MPFDHPLLNKIQREFIDTGRDARYRVEAYLFVLQGLEFFLSKKGLKKHVLGQELSRGLVEFAQRQFGPLTYEVLCYWGIHTTDDLGFIVYNLISIEAMSKTPSDSVEDFFNVFDMKEYFETADYYSIDKNHIRSIEGA